MMIQLFFAVALAGAPAETELESKLPVIFGRAAAHYKALDAAATPLMKDSKGEFRTPHGFNRATRQLDMRSIFWWTSGHFPGSLWYLYEATGDEVFKSRATAWTDILAPVARYEGNHDVGFMMYCSYGNARRILKTDRYDALLLETAHTLRKRYDEKLGLIRSWGKIGEKDNFLVIPDNLMNLELLEWAAEHKGGAAFGQIAQSHADMTMRHHFRPDGGCFHVLDYDQASGRVQGIRRGQGASCETAWSRGQSWGIYGYTMMYRMSGYIRYLDFAKKLADYAMNHPNMPADGIPYWDYGAPGEERDSSAGAIMASALMELSQYVGPADRLRYRAFAVRQLLALSSSAYFSEGDEIGHFLLKHGTGHKPIGSEVDTPLDYGDYYFLEALVRFRDWRRREKACASVASLLPPRAALPSDELDFRSRVNCGEDVLAVAEKALTEPIPETPDDLYAEFWTTGNRSHYQAPFFRRLKNLDALAYAELKEGKGRFRSRIEDYLTALCDMRSWVLPAHDWTDGNRGVFRGVWLYVDLFASEVSAHLACVIHRVGDRLRPEVVERVRANVERRILGPVRREMPTHLLSDAGCVPAQKLSHWWMVDRMNWNAVCWDNVLCTALGFLEDPTERAQFVLAADRAADCYLSGFGDDGYCVEGMGYWNYGFGHHLTTGRMLNRLTKGKYDFFRRPKQRSVAAYARAYTLVPGYSPAFADGNGAASKDLLKLVDEFWPDLPKTTPAANAFADAQVWLFRDEKALSVAFKGGNNAESGHNHNDIGSYYLMDRDRLVSGDPGGEVYTANTFNAHRYESKVLNSYGHPVPVVGGKLQSTGKKAAAKVVSNRCAENRSEVVLDITAAYDVPTLRSLTRTFVYDRKERTFTVRDHVTFSEPTAFEEAYTTFAGKAYGRASVEIRVPSGGQTVESVEHIDNPGRVEPDRHAVRFQNPVTEADIAFVFKSTTTGK